MLESNPSLGEVLATDLTFEQYLERFMGVRCEWIAGTVISTPPAGRDHYDLIFYLSTLLACYFELRPIGEIVHSPFTMRLRSIERGREPDLMVLLNGNPSPLSDTYLDGPADICVEIVSPESVERDYSAKFMEYERSAVTEYWLIDQPQQKAHFYRLGADGCYQEFSSAEGRYQTPYLPGLVLEVETLWQEKLPSILTIVAAVQKMI
jgi:Uma2 family endonuclease